MMFLVIIVWNIVFNIDNLLDKDFRVISSLDNMFCCFINFFEFTYVYLYLENLF